MHTSAKKYVLVLNVKLVHNIRLITKIISITLTSYATVACLFSATLHAWTLKSQQTRPCSWWWTVMRAGSHRQAGPDLRAVLATPGSTLSKRMLMLSHFHLYGEQRSSGVMGRRNGPSGLRDDDDDVYQSLVIQCSALHCPVIQHAPVSFCTVLLV